MKQLDIAEKKIEETPRYWEMRKMLALFEIDYRCDMTFDSHWKARGSYIAEWLENYIKYEKNEYFEENK